MKKFLIPSAIALLLSAGAANADSYVSVLGGAGFTPSQAIGATRSDMDTGFNVGARYGTYLNSYWDGAPSGLSLEGDLFYNQANYTGSASHKDSGSLMGNLIYHVDTGSALSLYGGAGLGPVMTQVSTPAGQDSQTVFGWQAIAGIEHPLADSNASVFAEYRYQDAHWANVEGFTHVGNTTDNVSVGLKFNL